jgi:hypothetical protein
VNGDEQSSFNAGELERCKSELGDVDQKKRVAFDEQRHPQSPDEDET